MDEFDDALYGVDLWREDYDGEITLIHLSDYPGFSIGLS
jgi:hypothetical protein